MTFIRCQGWTLQFATKDCICNGCWKPIIGNRYKCAVCNDYDLCGKCFVSIGHDKNHKIIKSVVDRRKEFGNRYRYGNVLCSACANLIAGCQFHCKFCVDYNLCIDCIKRGNHRNAHDLVQEMDILPYREDYWERTAAGLVCDGCFAPISAGKGLHCTICPKYNLCFNCVATNKHSSHRGGMIATKEEAKPHGNIICNSCGEYPIIGYRFKCRHCTNYDLCSKCFNKGVHKDFHIQKNSSNAPLAHHTNTANIASIECSICCEPYDTATRSPKLLPCGHTFCTSCLDFHIAIALTSSDKIIACPTCRRQHRKIANSNDLPKNFELINALTKFAIVADNTNGTFPCSECKSAVASDKLRCCITCLENGNAVKEHLCAECCLSNHPGHQVKKQMATIG